jgi:hypothetical protein
MMSQLRRSDLRESSDATYTDDADAFKKSTQIVGRLEVTDHDINDEYMCNTPSVSMY